MMDDFGGTTKYLVAKDIKNRFREIVYPEHHLSLPKLVNNLIEKSQEEIKSYSINAFSNICMVSAHKDKSIINAFKFFAEKMQALDGERVLEIRDALIGIGYVNIISSTEEDSYTIFEILNARGLELEDHELLKNYIMRYLQPVERRDDAKRIWEEIESNLGNNIRDFLRHYAIHKYNYNKKQGVNVYKTFQNATHGRKVNQLLDDINFKADYYGQMLNPSQKNSCEFEILSFFKSKRVTIFRPLILSLKHRLVLEQISNDRYNDFLQFLYNFHQFTTFGVF